MCTSLMEHIVMFIVATWFSNDSELETGYWDSVEQAGGMSALEI